MRRILLGVIFFVILPSQACDLDHPQPDVCDGGEISAADATWSHGDGDLQNTKRAPRLRLSGCFKGPIDTPTLQWSLDLSGIGTGAAPVIGDDGTIYLMAEIHGQPKFGGTRDAGLLAVYPNGMIKWYFSRPTDKTILYSKSVALGGDGSLYFVMWDSTLYALNSDGSMKWSRKGIFTADPVVDDLGRVYAASDTVFCFNPDGSLNWFFKNETPIQYCVRIVLGTSGLFCGFLQNGIAALDFNGKKRWFRSTFFNSLIHFGIVIDQNENLYYKTSNNQLESVNRHGDFRWSISKGSITEPIVRGNRLYFQDVGYLYIVDCKWGTEDSLLVIDEFDPIDFWSSPLLDDNGHLYFVAGYGVVYGYDLRTRSRLWKIQIPDYGQAKFIGYLSLSSDEMLHITSFNDVDPTQVNRLYVVK